MKKVFIACGPGRGGSDFENIDPWATEVCVAGGASEVWAVHVLDRLGPNEVDAALTRWCDWVCIGGTLTLVSYDLLNIAERLVTGGMSAADAAKILYDAQEGPDSTRRACYTLEQLCAAVEKNGLVVQKKRHVGMEAHVIATRN